MAAGDAVDVVIHMDIFTTLMHSHICANYIINTI
jgi:hypothetical protein